MKKGGNQVILETFSPGSLYEPGLKILAPGRPSEATWNPISPGSLYEPGLKLLAPGRLREATWRPISPGSCPNRD